MDHFLLLFDIDATLLHTGGAGSRAMARAGRELFGERFVWDGIEMAGGIDPLLAAEAARRSGIAAGAPDLERFRDLYLSRLREELEEGAAAVRIMPGIQPLLRSLCERADVVLGLLTGNYARGAALKLAAAGIDAACFTLGAFGDGAESRAALVAAAMRLYGERFGRAADPRRVLVVGDTPRDVEAARALGCIAFAVATGKFGRDALLAAGADAAVNDLADPRPLLDLIR